MNRIYLEDHLNDIYSSVQDGNLDCFYDLEEYPSERGYRKGFYGIGSEEGLDTLDDDYNCTSQYC